MKKWMIMVLFAAGLALLYVPRAVSVNSKEPTGPAVSQLKSDAEGKVDVNRKGPPPPPSEDYTTQTVLAGFPGIDRAEVLGFLKENMVQEMAEYRKLATWKPYEAMDLFTDMVNEALSLIATRAQSKELYDMKMRARELQLASLRYAEQIRVGAAGSDALAESSLEQALDEAFKVKQDLMKEDIRHVEMELERLKVLVRKREENRVAIVMARKKELMGETSYLKW